MSKYRDFFEEPLNRAVPYDTIIRILLRKIKLQEGIIDDLEDELKYYQHPHRFLSVLEHMTDDEKKALDRNPYYQKVKTQYMLLDDKYKRLKNERDVLYNIINTYVSRL